MKAKLIPYLSIPTFTVLNWRWTREDGWLLLHEMSFLQGPCVKQATTHGTYFGLLLFLHSNLLLDLEACVANQTEGNEVAIWLLPGTLLTKDNAPPPRHTAEVIPLCISCDYLWCHWFLQWSQWCLLTVTAVQGWVCCRAAVELWREWQHQSLINLREHSTTATNVAERMWKRKREVSIDCKAVCNIVWHAHRELLVTSYQFPLCGSVGSQVLPTCKLQAMENWAGLRMRLDV